MTDNSGDDERQRLLALAALANASANHVPDALRTNILADAEKAGNALAAFLHDFPFPMNIINNPAHKTREGLTADMAMLRFARLNWPEGVAIAKARIESRLRHAGLEPSQYEAKIVEAAEQLVTPTLQQTALMRDMPHAQLLARK